jgi:mannosyl-3-phosphoglycerate phosphatase family protein
LTQLVIYTDLDGSLLDHYDYSYSKVEPILGRLESEGIPVVFCSSKTRPEQLSLRKRLNNAHPFIIENGAAVLIPEGYFPAQPPETEQSEGYWIKSFTQPRQHWLDLLDSIAPEFAGDFDNFARLETEQIVALTGLDGVAAEAAAKRDYGEPVHWLGSEDSKQRFIQKLERAGATILQGGRFLHISGDCDKGKALAWLHSHYANSDNTRTPVSLAIGDSQNDAAMLETADHALIIRSPSHQPPTLSRKGQTYLSRFPGPDGWLDGVNEFLSSLKKQE